MYLIKLAFLLALVICVQSKYIPSRVFLHDLEDQTHIQANYQDYDRSRSIRNRRQTLTQRANVDGSQDFNVKMPIDGNDRNTLSALGSVNVREDGNFGPVGGGLALDNVNGHGLSLTGRHIPGFGNQLTAAGRATLLDTEDHRVGANAFATRNMPNTNDLSNFNTFGGGLDYMYKDKVGASLDISHTPMLQQTDYSAMGKLNLFKDRDSSFDVNAGFTKSESPFMRDSMGWQPGAGLSYTKYF